MMRTSSSAPVVIHAERVYIHTTRQQGNPQQPERELRRHRTFLQRLWNIRRTPLRRIHRSGPASEANATTNRSNNVMSLTTSINGGIDITMGPTVIYERSNPPRIPVTNENSPSAIYRNEVAASKKHVSSDEPEHKFWLKADLQGPIMELLAMHAYAGTVLHSTRLTMFVKETVRDKEMILPQYIAHTLPFYTENECRMLFRQVCRAVQVLHANKTVHRNLHLNHMVVEPTTGHVSLRGFQQAVRLQKNRLPVGDGGEEEKWDDGLSSLEDSSIDCVDPYSYFTDAPLDDSRSSSWFAFRAPELETPGLPHGTAVDVWALGASLYVLLTGVPPFLGNGRTLKAAKMSADVAPYELTVPTGQAQDLVARMLRADPSDRLSIAQVLQHEWLATAGGGESDEESDSDAAAAVAAFYASSDLSLAQAILQDWSRKSKPSKRARQNDD